VVLKNLAAGRVRISCALNHGWLECILRCSKAIDLQNDVESQNLPNSLARSQKTSVCYGRSKGLECSWIEAFYQGIGARQSSDPGDSEPQDRASGDLIDKFLLVQEDSRFKE
jgi:hypothetical protein